MNFRHILLAALLAVAACAVTDSTVHNNGIGWDGGLSYRRLLAHGWWFGLVATGSASETASDSWYRTETREFQPETTIVEMDAREDTMLVARAGVRVLVGKQVAAVKWVALSLFAKPGYTYEWRNRESSDNEYRDKQTSHRIECSAGLEPAVWLLDRICLGTRFGLLYEFTVSEGTSDYAHLTDSYLRVGEAENDQKRHSLSIIGVPFSLTMSLVAHFYF